MTSPENDSIIKE